jgi:vacuolar-type H+-ATPase subunit I/STV1
MGKSKIDDELTELLTKLYTMQEDVGAKPKSTDEEKKQRAETAATMGTGRKAQAKGSRFLELRSTIIQRIKSIHSKLQQVKDLENAGYGGDNPTQVIKLQAEIREEIRQVQDEWKELDAIYKKEARKKRSKFTPEELETQQQLVQQLYEQIEKVREAQMAGFARGGAPVDSTAALLSGGSRPRQASVGKCVTT